MTRAFLASLVALVNASTKLNHISLPQIEAASSTFMDDEPAVTTDLI